MPLFFHKSPKPLTPPAGFGIGDVRTESSICTGETTIGFYDPAAGKLLCAVVVRTQADIDAFFASYGWKRPEQ